MGRFLFGERGEYGAEEILRHGSGAGGLGSKVSASLGQSAWSGDGSLKSGEEIGRAFYIGFAVHGRLKTSACFLLCYNKLAVPDF